MTREPAGAASTRPARLLLLAYAAFVVYGSFFPFQFRIDLEEVQRDLARFWGTLALFDARGRRLFSIADLVSNLLLGAPVGVLLVRGRLVGRGVLSRVAGVLAIEAVFAGLVEVGQILAPGRTASVVDVLAQMAGALGGALAVHALGADAARRSAARLAALARQRPALLVVALVAALLAADALYPYAVTLDVSTAWDNIDGGEARRPYPSRDIDRRAIARQSRRMTPGTRIVEWPVEERPRERLYHHGAAALADAELLAIQLGAGARGRNAVELARDLLVTYGSLSALAARGVAELAGRPGMGRAKAVRLAAAFELTRRLRSRNGHGRAVLSSPAEVFARYGPLMEDLDKEVFRIALLDAQNGLLRDVVVSEGTLSASLVHPREVFKPAILESAASLILLHNHPSGDPTPSREDLRLTRQLVECSRLLELHIHDHVVIGHGRFASLAERGEL